MPKRIDLPADEIIYMRDVEKKSFTYIADCFGVSWSCLMQNIKRQGIKIKFNKRVGNPNRRFTFVDRNAQALGYSNKREAIINLRPTHQVADIAKVLGCSKGCIEGILHQEEITGFRIEPNAHTNRVKAGKAGWEARRLAVFNGDKKYYTIRKSAREFSIERMSKVMEENFGMYYTPKQILDPTSGSGAFLKTAADSIIGNPPYGEQIYLAQIRDATGEITSQEICRNVSECAKFFEERGIRFYGNSAVTFSDNVYTYQKE